MKAKILLFSICALFFNSIQPAVMINIIAFPSARAAKEKLQKKFGTAEAKQYFKRLRDQPETLEYEGGDLSRVEPGRSGQREHPAV